MTRWAGANNHVRQASRQALVPLAWRHHGRDGVLNHQPQDCLLIRLFRCRSKETSKLPFVRGIHLWHVNSSHKAPVTRKMLPVDVIMQIWVFTTTSPKVWSNLGPQDKWCNYSDYLHVEPLKINVVCSQMSDKLNTYNVLNTFSVGGKDWKQVESSSRFYRRVEYYFSRSDTKLFSLLGRNFDNGREHRC